MRFQEFRVSFLYLGMSELVGVWRLCGGTEAGSYLRLIDSCLTQLKAQGPSRTCDESKEEEEEETYDLTGPSLLLYYSLA